MLRHALNAAISMDPGAPQAHELLLAKSIFAPGIQRIQAQNEHDF